MTELELERALADLAAHLEQPQAPPPFAGAVMARIAEGPAADARRARVPGVPGLPRVPGLRLPRRGWRRVAVAALALLVLAAGIVVATPGAREAVARRLGILGIEIHQGGPAPTVTAPTVTAPTGTTAGRGATGTLGLGRRVSLEQARAGVSFRLLVPSQPGFERPDAVYLSDEVPGGRVDLVYLPRPGLPASPFTNAGLLITEFQATPLVGKFVKAGTRIEEVVVSGEQGYWLGGEPHEFVYQDRNGVVRQETARLAGSTLIWTRGPVTLRLEGQVTKQQALRLAGSMR
jgi:hypothetical protein